MSVGPTRGPVQRPDLNRDLTEIFQRLEDLERVTPGGGDYVFLQETILDAPAATLDFNTIDQGYQHLVLELLLKREDMPDDMTQAAGITWNGYFGYDWASEGIPDDSQFNVSDDIAVMVGLVVPSATEVTASLYGAITAKFPFYSLASLVKSVRFEGIVANDGLSFEGYNAAQYVSGGGQSIYDPTDSSPDPDGTDPITFINITCGYPINPGTTLFAAGSRGQLYGIKKH